MLAWCIPLCLIVTVWSVTILPAMLPVGKDMSAEGMNDMLAEENMGSLVCSYTEVEIQDANKSSEHYEKITDKVEVTRIFSSIYALLSDVNGADQDANKNYDDINGEGDQQTDSISNLSGYIITFKTESGSQTVYNISENTLFNVSTNEQITFTDAQVDELMLVLGISK